MSRHALVVGINYYEYSSDLEGCVNDAKAVGEILRRHANGDINFNTVRTLVSENDHSSVTRMSLKDEIRDLFKEDHEVALFYFAGHGHMETTGGYLLTTESTRGDDGVALSEVLTIVAASPAKNKIVILDSCNSGFAGQVPVLGGGSLLAEGVTILTASTSTQEAMEYEGRGLFTGLLLDALNGAAANLEGDVTPGLVYAHIDQALGATQQRPVFKTNVKTFVSLRKNEPIITKADLLKIDDYFKHHGFKYQLDPSYEPRDEGRTSKMPKADPKHNAIFEVLQKYNRINLLVPKGASKPHMWHAAMEEGWCELTPLGEHYRKMVKSGTI